MKTLLLALLAALALPFSAMAMEPRFSAMVSDVETGLILTADRIDSPRSPALMGRMATLTMAIQDLADGSASWSDRVQNGRQTTIGMLSALQITAIGEAGYRAPMTGLVNLIAGNAQGFKTRIDTISEVAGLQASAVRIERGSDGGPVFEGYTTPRDMVRLAVSALRAFPDTIQSVYGPATGNIASTQIWIYQDGMCMLSANGPLSGRRLIAALTGAPDENGCLAVAAEMISLDDARIARARSVAR